MKPFVFARLLCAGLVLAVSGAAARAGGNYDGRWSVELVTMTGDCDRSLSWEVGVRSGRISESGAFGQAAGVVDSQGRVRLQVVNGADRMSASGKLKGQSGSGAWTAPSRACSGRWRATRG